MSFAYRQFPHRADLPDGFVLLAQVNEEFVDFVDLSVLLLPLEMDQLVELSEVIQVCILQSMVPLEQDLYLAAIFGLLYRDFYSKLVFRLFRRNDGPGRGIRSNRYCFCFWLRNRLLFYLFFFFCLYLFYFCFRLFYDNRFWFLDRDRLLRESWWLSSRGFDWRFDRRWSYSWDNHRCDYLGWDLFFGNNLWLGWLVLFNFCLPSLLLHFHFLFLYFI